ncbi:methylenetetrahydrofolate reductase [Actinomycetospora endophytica]|uniref:Methylenetetrahydrofolate reductase n=1 Tax=Actinomycetospora endophytica TaxID=2291215 RepID=A0ABS8PI89_9PSEU|nr:methylenetetrahydrofolate reductase [Actinomycetospora endophytica]MCD2196704.1 methylenetetrahydrofolate reductase [Actinomycetospora endophytica]
MDRAGIPGAADDHTDPTALAALLAHPRWEVVPTAGVLEAAVGLPAGATVTVTASPGRGVEATVAVAEGLAARGFAAVPHLAARSLHDRAELAGYLERLAGVGVDDVFVVGGDAREPAGEFADGLALLRAIEELGRPARVGVPSYPDGHHRISDDVLWADLRAKQAHADYTVTQLCFDADRLCAFVGEARRRGVDLPVVAGIPGVVDTARLLRIGIRIGVTDAARFARSHRSTAAALLRPGRHRPDELVARLAAHVAAGDCDLERVHVYTFNQIEPTVRWLSQAGRAAA